MPAGIPSRRRNRIPKNVREKPNLAFIHFSFYFIILKKAKHKSSMLIKRFKRLSRKQCYSSSIKFKQLVIFFGVRFVQWYRKGLKEWSSGFIVLFYLFYYMKKDNWTNIKFVNLQLLNVPKQNHPPIEMRRSMEICYALWASLEELPLAARVLDLIFVKTIRFIQTKLNQENKILT